MGLIKSVSLIFYHDIALSEINPPPSPWMGGIWKALIKSVKCPLKVVIQDHMLTNKMISTLMCEVESILKQKPPTHVSDVLNDNECLTPNHFFTSECNNLSSMKISD